MKRLDIIGNGFDLHHGIPSRMEDFERYLASADHTVHRMVRDYFGVDAKFWSEFETRLADFDAEAAIDYASQFLDDKWYSDFQYELQQIGEGLSVRLQRHFTDWVRSLVIPDAADVRLISVDPTARFLSFNYTATLEQLYEVPPEQVLHIHGLSAIRSEPSFWGTDGSDDRKTA